MKLKSSKQADELHEKNCLEIRRLIEVFKNPDTSEEERAEIKAKFERILEHADKIQKQHTLFTKMTAIKNNGTHKK